MIVTKVSIVLTLLYCAVHHFDGADDHVIGTAQFELCPKVEICEKNATSAELRPNGSLERDSISCCRCCSCHPDCKRYMNCCFPDDKENSTKADDDNNNREPVCTHMRVGSHDRQWNAAITSYYTIWAGPPGGCVNIQPFQTGSGQTMLPSCGPQPIAEWGELFPVFSSASKAIYKNEACAQCHGVSDYERFSPSLVCEKSLEGAALVAALEVYNTGTLPPTCYVEFRHHDETVLRSRRCLKNPVSTCTSGTIAPLAESMNLTFDATATACESGLHSPVLYIPTRTAYKNVFCLLCGARITYPDSLFSDDLILEAPGPQELTFILDARMAKPANQKRGVAGPIACLKENDKLLETTCRAIHCSPGRVRNNEGQCIFIGPTWMGHVLAMMIQLEPFGESAMLFKDDPSTMIADIIKSNPWPAGWVLPLVYTKRRDGFRKTGANIAVAIAFKGMRFRVDSLWRGIHTMLSKPWNVEVNGSRLEFKQSLLGYDLAGVLKQGALTPTWTAFVSNSNSSVSSDESVQWLNQPTGMTHFLYLVSPASYFSVIN